MSSSEALMTGVSNGPSGSACPASTCREDVDACLCTEGAVFDVSSIGERAALARDVSICLGVASKAGCRSAKYSYS